MRYEIELPEDIGHRLAEKASATGQDVVSLIRVAVDRFVSEEDGQQVEVQVKVKSPGKEWGAGILRTAGALADDPYWDAIMDEVQQARKSERRLQLDGE